MDPGMTGVRASHGVQEDDTNTLNLLKMIASLGLKVGDMPLLDQQFNCSAQEILDTLTDISRQRTGDLQNLLVCGLVQPHSRGFSGTTTRSTDCLNSDQILGGRQGFQAHSSRQSSAGDYHSHSDEYQPDLQSRGSVRSNHLSGGSGSSRHMSGSNRSNEGRPSFMSGVATPATPKHMSGSSGSGPSNRSNEMTAVIETPETPETPAEPASQEMPATRLRAAEVPVQRKEGGTTKKMVSKQMKLILRSRRGNNLEPSAMSSSSQLLEVNPGRPEGSRASNLSSTFEHNAREDSSEAEPRMSALYGASNYVVKNTFIEPPETPNDMKAISARHFFTEQPRARQCSKQPPDDDFGMDESFIDSAADSVGQFDLRSQMLAFQAKSRVNC